MNLVLDSNVGLRWAIPTEKDLPGREQAIEILDGVRDGRIKVIVPSHFHTEIAAVLVRTEPDRCEVIFDEFCALELTVIDDPLIYLRAMKLAKELKHPLYDTKYHALALETEDTMFVTADEQYFRKAKRLGSIVSLAEFRLPPR